MRVLVAVKTCARYRARADAQRATWACLEPLGYMPRFDVKVDIRWFLGGQPSPSSLGWMRSEEVVLPAPDDYHHLPAKVREICRWSARGGYDWTFMCDDDAYVQLDRLLDAVPDHNVTRYHGRFRGPSDPQHPWPYCSGFGYWLHSSACASLAGSDLTSDYADDRWVGKVLRELRYNGSHDERYRVTRCDPRKVQGRKGDVGTDMVLTGLEGPLASNDLIAACEFEGDEMPLMHTAWLESLRISK